MPNRAPERERLDLAGRIVRRSNLPADIFPHRQLVRGFEGGAIYRAEYEGKYYVIESESALNDLLSDEDKDGCPSIRVYEFDSEEELGRYLRTRGWIQ